MRSILNYRISPGLDGTECQQRQGRHLAWLSAVALGTSLCVGLGCTSANRPQPSPFAAGGPAVESTTAGSPAIGSGVESAAVGPADLPATVAAENPAAVEDPQVAAAFARLAQARAEMAQLPRIASTPATTRQRWEAPTRGITAQPNDPRLTDFDGGATITARDQPWPSPEMAVPVSSPAWTGTR